MRERKRIFKPKFFVGLVLLMVMTVGASVTVLADDSTTIKKMADGSGGFWTIAYQLEERQGEGANMLTDYVSEPQRQSITFEMVDGSTHTFAINWGTCDYDSAKDSFSSNSLIEANGHYYYFYGITGTIDTTGYTFASTFDPQLQTLWQTATYGFYIDGGVLKAKALGQCWSNWTDGYAERKLRDLAQISNGITINTNSNKKILFKDNNSNLVLFTDVKIVKEEIQSPAQALVEAVQDADLDDKTVEYIDIDVLKKSNSEKLNVVGDGIPFILPYPEGTNSSYNFDLKHWNGSQLENVPVTKTSSGIQFTQGNFSPFVLAYEAGGNQPVVESKRNENKEEKQEETTYTPKANLETNPSVLAGGVVSTGGINLKALNTDKKGLANHKMVANLFAGQYHKGKTYTIVATFDIYSPWSITADWKNTKRTIDWKVNGAKAGDTYFAVYYNQTVGMVQYLPCTVKDGVVSFAVPKLGDVSTISIVTIK